ncbi:hypothetical protein [uncultured Castellaniella sp.]|uniref:hypothetical protein n=1 Tax=uncultured Castellaniella sp. TaxID=647907 RepID=UPI0026141EB4|nr:hypothetical protein [uncultured Castellaniella sp.]
MIGIHRKGQAGEASPPDDRRPGLPEWLHLAATPTFALMALLTAIPGGAEPITCLGMTGASPLSGMSFMYLLMGVFHAAPWVKLACRARRP